MASVSLSSDKMTWMVVCIGAALAIYTTYWQLDNFKKRTVIKPSSSPSHIGVKQSTEDAIKLKSLAALACGANPELRSAALKILCERGLKEDALSAILDKADSTDFTSNFIALRILGLLYETVSPRRLMRPRVFQSLLGMLRRASVAVTTEKKSDAICCQREAISMLSRLISLGDDCQQYAIDAGLIDWIKESRVAGYDNIFTAVITDHSEPGDQDLYDLLSAVYRVSGTGRTLDPNSALPETSAGSNRPFEQENDDWVEAEVDDATSQGPGLRAPEPAAEAPLIPEDTTGGSFVSIRTP